MRKYIFINYFKIYNKVVNKADYNWSSHYFRMINFLYIILHVLVRLRIFFC